MRGDLLYADRHVFYYVANALLGLFVLFDLPVMACPMVFMTSSKLHYVNIGMFAVSCVQLVHFAVVVLRIVRFIKHAISAIIDFFHSDVLCFCISYIR